MSDIVFDLECDGLSPTKIYCVSYNNLSTGIEDTITDAKEIKRFFLNLTEEDRLIGHSIITFDIPVLERLLNITVQAELVDTLYISWYIYPNRSSHGLAGWGEDLGIPKPKIDDWEGLTAEEYCYRCEEDVKINTSLWSIQSEYLNNIYDGKPEPLIQYLAFKASCARLQEETKWKLDVPKASQLLTTFCDKQDLAKDTLQTVMPKVKRYTKKIRPAKPYKIDGSLSATGLKWEALTTEHNVPFDYNGEIEVFHSLQEPNAGSSKQIKDWLYDLGWQPATYKFIKEVDGERKIPQIKTADGELCPSIERMVAKNPELASLAELGVLSHRIGIVKGFLEAEVDGYVVAGIQGLTNTLRFKHRTCVNIPSSRKPYGSEIRELLTSDSGYELCGSDMSNLEGRVKEHYVYPIDPDFVESVNTDGYDGHIEIAIQSGMMTRDEGDFYKWYKENH